MNFNTCVNADSIEWMTNYQGEPFADLIFADPPFNIGWEYDICIDEKTDLEFINWNREWINLAATKCLKPYGTMLICMGDEYVSDIDVMCRRDLGLHRQNWMIWHYEFGQSGKLHSRKRFVRSKTHVLRFSKHKAKFKFDATRVAVPSKRQTMYADSRADMRGKCPNDVFIHKRIAGTHKDRVPHMTTQMPIELVTPWILAMTDHNDLVYDPFPGSGVTLAAAKNKGRQYFGTELSPAYHQHILNRLA